MDKLVENRVLEVIHDMEPISLKEMDHVKLMQRQDTKFVIESEKVDEILNEVNDKYYVLEIDGERIHAYHTVYYDTADFSMYLNHHNKRLNRYKIRVREYLSSGISFLEIKFKNNKRETIKKRVPPGQGPNNSIKLEGEFLVKNSPYNGSELNPSLQNFFKRITLVNKVSPERITIDIELRYESVNGDKKLELPGISVIEVKRSKDSSHSDMIDSLRKHHVQSMGFSKYCMGTALIQEDVKKNLFRKRMRELGRYEETFRLAK